MHLHDVVGAGSLKQYPDIPQINIDTDNLKQVLEVCKPWNEPPGVFTLISRVGEGAYGVIFKAQLHGKTVAAKKLKDHVCLRKRYSDTVDWSKKDHKADQAYNDLLTELAVLVSMGKHPNLVQFMGACLADEQNPIIFEEFVEGPSLANFFSKKAGAWVPPRSVTYHWIVDMVRGLEFLHNRDPVIIHRDVKPGNLLLTKDLMCLKIADFGMSKMVRRGQVGRGPGNTGTEAYMAPEVFHKEQAQFTDRMDIYSAAVIMWYIATGQGGMLYSRRTGDDWRPDLSVVEWEELKTIISWAWSAKPESRPSASALLEGLQKMPNLPPPIQPMIDFGPPGCQCSIQ